MPTYPETYLHVRECRSGREWVQEIRPRQTLNLRRRVAEWVRAEFGGELVLDGELMPRLDGEFYARIMTDGREPESVICWDGGGFYLKAAY